MRFQRISYYIHDRQSPDKRRPVVGYAVDAPDSMLRFCVREDDFFFEGWRIDHWETGAAILPAVSQECHSKESAAFAAIGILTVLREQVPCVVKKAKDELGDAYPLNPEPSA